jgi:hypothetical protein
MNTQRAEKLRRKLRQKAFDYTPEKFTKYKRIMAKTLPYVQVTKKEPVWLSAHN